MIAVRLRCLFLWLPASLVGLPQVVRGDELLFSYDADIHPAAFGGGFEIFAACTPPNCSESLANGHFIIQWGQFGDAVNYNHDIANAPEKPPPNLWIEWRFRSNWPLPPGDDGCDAHVHVQFRDGGNPAYLHGDACVSFSGSDALFGLGLDQFYTLRFESEDGATFSYAADGRVFTVETRDFNHTGHNIQFGGLAFCDRPPNGTIRNEWDFVRYGTLGDGETITASDPPVGLVDANEYPNLDRFTVTFDQPGFVYVDDLSVESTGSPIPQVRWTRRLDNGLADRVEVVLDRPLPVNAITTITLHTGGDPQVITYAYFVLGSCCLPSGACIQTDEPDCVAQNGTLSAGGQCQGDVDGDGVDISCGDQCDMDPNKTTPGQCGCGLPDIDSDGDTVADCLDRCDSEDDRIDEDDNGTPDCAQFQPIPTMSVWGLGILALLLLIIAKLRSIRYSLFDIRHSAAVFFILCASAAADPVLRYAKTNGIETGDCDSWAAACTLDRARTVAASGDEIWVKAGTYGPFALKNGVKIIGGFTGTETAASQSNPAANVTIVDGNDQDQCVTGSGEGTTTTLRGFTIRNCNISSHEAMGAGVYLHESSARIVQCIIEQNDSHYFGAGAAIEGTASPEFINCIFRANGSGSGTSVHPYGGGAVHAYSGSPKFTNCLFHDNVAGEGGAVLTVSGTPTFVNCTFSQNSAEIGQGGAIYDQAGLVTVQNSVLWNNEAVKGGDEIANATGFTTTVTYCDVEGGYTGTGNINSDPAFVNAGSDDFKLATCSPCRNVGSNGLLPLDVADLDWDTFTTTEIIPKDLALGNRKVGGGVPPVVDMGAYEGTGTCSE